MEFIRLPSRIVNLSQIREISFEGCISTIHWHDGKTYPLSDIDAAILLDALERRYGLLTDPAARWWEVGEEENSNHITRSHFADTVPLPEEISQR